MGTLSNANSVTSAAIAANDMNDTPTHWTGWRESGQSNLLAQGTLLDDSTGLTPVFDVAVGSTLTFGIGDFSFPLTPGAGQEEALYTDLLDTGSGGFNMWIQLHTGAPGNAGTANQMDLAPFEINNWSYAES